MKAAEAGYREARAAVEAARAPFFPTLSATGSAQRSGTAASTASVVPTVRNNHSLALGASWEPDSENRLIASVALVEAFGGGWHVSQLPGDKAMSSTAAHAGP